MKLKYGHHSDGALSRRGGARGSSDAILAAASSRREAVRRLPGRIAITEADAGAGSNFFRRASLGDDLMEPRIAHSASSALPSRQRRRELRRALRRAVVPLRGWPKAPRADRHHGGGRGGRVRIFSAGPPSATIRRNRGSLLRLRVPPPRKGGNRGGHAAPAGLAPRVSWVEHGRRTGDATTPPLAGTGGKFDAISAASSSRRQTVQKFPEPIASTEADGNAGSNCLCRASFGNDSDEIEDHPFAFEFCRRGEGTIQGPRSLAPRNHCERESLCVPFIIASLSG